MSNLSLPAATPVRAQLAVTGSAARVVVHAPRRRKENSLRQRLNRLLTLYIETNLHEPITVNRLAGYFGLSEAYFSRIFARDFGMSPHRYVLYRRAERAKYLLLTTDAPLAKIALDCGLCDQPHFNKMFRKFTGSAPGIWRNEQRQALRRIRA